MTDESEHDHVSESLHDAFGAEVADLDIAVMPVEAVMTGGAALRARRRLAVVSGVAALAVLPVAAVAVFSGGSGATEAGGRPSDNPDRTSAVHTLVAPGGTTTRPRAATPTPSGTVILPQLTLPPAANTTAPDPNDVVTVLGSGVTDGKPWRLVRDEYVIAMGQGRPSPSLMVDQSHLPMSRLGSPGTGVCRYVGVQWGTRPPGTQPDFNAAGECSKEDGAGTVPLSLGPVDGPAGSGMALWALIGQVADTSKVARVSVTSSHGVAAPNAIFRVPGESDGYYVVFLPPLTDGTHHSLTITAYDAGGHVVASTSMGG